MGVHGLWPLLHPVARPVALETMGGKRLAIDSSIWLYQFQIAMRDKDGRALDNAHILGFLRRICKLLFYGIKPVFVFDGGAPLIKKLAISHRKNKKRGAKETAAKTAEKLLSAQLRAAAVAAAQKEAAQRGTGEQIDEVNANYLDEDYGIQPRGAPVRRGTGSSPAKAAAASQPTEITPPKRKYVHKDQYALPVIDEPLAKRAKLSDPRIATDAELRSFIDDMRPEDFDMDSEFFNNLPIEAKYEIIGDLRIKSRQSNFKRVEAMRAAPTPLDFSKAQILGLSHRNTLTQKLLTVTDSLSRVQSVTPMRVAGERNKEYVLIKNNDSQGAGYILGIREDGKSAASPVKIEGTTTEESDQEKTTTDEEFEAVPIPNGNQPRAASPDAAHRRNMAMEAIKQRYSPVKAKAADSDDEGYSRKNGRAALFLKGTSAHFVEDDTADLPVNLMAQIDSAVQSADERENLRQAIQASIRDYEGQEAKSTDSDAESDISFDEVKTCVSPRQKKNTLPENARVYTNTALRQRAETTRHTDTSSIEVVIPVPKQASPAMHDTISSAQPSSSNGLTINACAVDTHSRIGSNFQDHPALIVAAKSDGAVTSKPLRQQTPRPDLTIAQARRDTSPQKEMETADHVIHRDYAQQAEAASDKQPTRSSTPPQTHFISAQISTREVSPMEFVMPDAADLLPMPDLSAFNGELPPASTTGVEAALQPVRGHTPVQDPDEVHYEWSASPEPQPRPQNFLDVSKLDPGDPRYIPEDIELAESGHELSDLEDEDREQIASVTTEQREYAKFLSELKNRNLDEMEFEAQNELRVLNQQNKKDKAMADDITQQMAKDIQTMLRVLGLPYVIAPMEAEAQCAELLSRALVDGVITDDNDVFLFGATRVYKNMFNQNKYVECYLTSDIERELALDRERLIRLAHFLGSDYCDGLPGVGPVLGMELMAEFPGADGLQQFRDWWLRVQRGKDTASDHPTAFKRKFKKSKRDIFLDESWPNTEVTKAYLFPQVDDSDEPFAWGIPDLDAMRDFLKDSLGWGAVKVDELLLPIIKRMTGRAAGSAVNQSTINSFFDVSGGTGRYAPMANKGYESKRLQAVVKAWRQSQKQLAKEENADLSLEESDFSDVAPAKARQASSSRTVSRQNSGTRSRSRASSSRSRSRSVQSDHLLDQSDDDFHAQLEDALSSMGIKRKREAPQDSDRIIKRAAKGKRESGRNGRLLSRKASAERRKRDRAAFLASESEASDYEENQAITRKQRSKKKSDSVRSSRVNSDNNM